MKKIHRTLGGLLALALLPSLSARSLKEHDIVVEKELLITAPEVVDSDEASYPGIWSFGRLAEGALGRDEAPLAIRKWLESWAKGGESGDIPGRHGVYRLMEVWQDKDGHDEWGKEEWIPDLANAPFRLLAIVNRMDLGTPTNLPSNPNPSSVTPQYYSSSGNTDSSFGEGRLVFGLIEDPAFPRPDGTTLIFEYGLGREIETPDRIDLAVSWHQLGKHKSFDEKFRYDLSLLTRRFTNPVIEEKSTKAPLLRIRINDGSFGPVREFRQFDCDGSTFKAARLAGTPPQKYFDRGSTENRKLGRHLRKSQTFEDDQSTERANILKGRGFQLAMNVTATHVAPIPENDASYHWDAPAMGDHALRRAFSMQTCCGCHCGDTGTEFFHIAPREKDQFVQLSAYLTNKSYRVRDPASKRKTKITEMEDRITVFENILNPRLSRREARKLHAARANRAH